MKTVFGRHFLVHHAKKTVFGKETCGTQEKQTMIPLETCAFEQKLRFLAVNKGVRRVECNPLSLCQLVGDHRAQAPLQANAHTHTLRNRHSRVFVREQLEAHIQHISRLDERQLVVKRLTNDLQQRGIGSHAIDSIHVDDAQARNFARLANAFDDGAARGEFGSYHEHVDTLCNGRSQRHDASTAHGLILGILGNHGNYFEAQAFFFKNAVCICPRTIQGYALAAQLSTPLGERREPIICFASEIVGCR